MCTPAFWATVAAALVSAVAAAPPALAVPLPARRAPPRPARRRTARSWPTASSRCPARCRCGPRLTVLCVIADSAARMADRRATCRPRCQPADRRQRGRVIGGRDRGLEAALLERDHADVHAGRLRVDERLRRLSWRRSSRLGATSVAAMLPETSMARMTVPLACDTGTDTDGPATATASTAMPAMVQPEPGRPGRACGAGGATPAAASAAARRRATTTAAHARATATSRPTASSTGSAKVMRACAWCSRRPRSAPWPGPASCRCGARHRRPGAFPRRGGRRAPRTPARSRARSSGSPESTTSCSPVSASSTTTRPAVGQFVVGRVDDAQRDDLVPRRRGAAASVPSRRRR